VATGSNGGWPGSLAPRGVSGAEQHDALAVGMRPSRHQGLAFTWSIIKGDGSPKRPTKIRFRRSCELALLCSGSLLGGLTELFGGAFAGFLSHLKLRLHFLKIATAPGEVLSDSAEGFTVLLQANLQPLLCLRSLIQSMLRTVE
jgi:hypothetical protein